MSAIYGIAASPDDVNVFGAGHVHRFQAGSLGNAQSYAQALSTLMQVNLYLLDENANPPGETRTKYTPGTAGSSVSAPTGIVHK